MHIVDPKRDWRAPIAAGAYLTMSVCASVLVTFILGYFLFVRPIEHSQQLAKTALRVNTRQAALRQNDTNTIANFLCIARTRSLVSYRDPNTSARNKKASLEAADAYERIIRGLSAHPPTKCLGVDPNP